MQPQALAEQALQGQARTPHLRMTSGRFGEALLALALPEPARVHGEMVLLLADQLVQVDRSGTVPRSVPEAARMPHQHTPPSDSELLLEPLFHNASQLVRRYRWSELCLEFSCALIVDLAHVVETGKGFNPAVLGKF